MEKRFRSIVEELNDYAPNRNRELIIEGRAQQVIASATHLMRLIRESFDAETADDLSKRLVRSIASGDEEKFCRRIRGLRESREKKG